MKLRLFPRQEDAYFGLFQAAAEVLPGPRSAIGRRLIEFFLRIWEDPSQRDQMMGMLRGATTSPHVADMLGGGRLRCRGHLPSSYRRTSCKQRKTTAGASFGCT